MVADSVHCVCIDNHIPADGGDFGVAQPSPGPQIETPGALAFLGGTPTAMQNPAGKGEQSSPEGSKRNNGGVGTHAGFV